MKIILSSMLALTIAGSPVLAQEPEPKEKPKQEEPKKPSGAKSKQEPDEKAKPKPQPEKPKQEPAPPPKEAKPGEKQQKEQAKPEKDRPQQEQTARPDHRNQQAREKGQRIPLEKFRAGFGREHPFRVARRDDHRFHYSGYWFEVVEVWPAGWSFDDDCYIEDDGSDYYLVDMVHPEIRVLVVVVSA